MPLTRSAIKKQRKDQKREKQNDLFKRDLKRALSKVNKNASADLLKKAFSLVDKAVKKHIIHQNKAARIKSKLAKIAVEKKEISKPSAAKSTKSKTSTKTKKLSAK